MKMKSALYIEKYQGQGRVIRNKVKMTQANSFPFAVPPWNFASLGEIGSHNLYYFSVNHHVGRYYHECGALEGR